MRRLTAFLVGLVGWAQVPQARIHAPAETVQAALVAFVRENYTKYERRVPMRDGVKLFTAVYVPKDVATYGKTYPVLFTRTPYSSGPYGEDKYRRSLGPSELFTREKYIFVYQDVRGRYMSEGEFVVVRPQKPVKSGPNDIDESTDAYDSIEWLLKNIAGNNGKVGIWGISQPGFFATASLIGAHPALAAVSPQAPVTDYYLGDDVYHNGAFMLAHRFGMYQGFRPREGDPAPPPPALPFEWGTPDAYEFFLNLGPLVNAEDKHFKGKQPYWALNVENTSYSEVWRSRSIWRYLGGVRPAVLTVGGWFDSEDPQGPLRMFEFMEKNSPPATNVLVMGPWTHGGFARGDGDHVGNVTFGSKTSEFYRKQIEFPFFQHFLKGSGDGKFPKAWAFETGTNQWRRFESWPPRQAKAQPLYLSAGGRLTRDSDSTPSYTEYLADPAKPVPYIAHIAKGVRGDYMTEDQRFAAYRPDVLVFRTEPLDHDVTVFGPISVDLKVSTTGTDSDFVVKLIDVYPGDYPDYSAPVADDPDEPPSRPPRDEPANTIRMGGYQQLVRGEPFRGKYRKSFEKAIPFEPGKPDRITFRMPDVGHTFRQGHRIMVQVQSSWFPLTDRNPQKFVDIPKARESDFVKATQRVYSGGADGSRIELFVFE
ncbi:MAG: CocE/NonD family hydrolase [Acidobacteria bacterium]|nr:CocE/NonD family hydrolase [Acidobacteriota bacterium]